MIPESLQGLARQETQAPDLGSRGGGAGTRPTPTTPWEGGQAGHSWPRKPQPKRKKDLLNTATQETEKALKTLPSTWGAPPPPPHPRLSGLGELLGLNPRKCQVPGEPVPQVGPSW